MADEVKKLAEETARSTAQIAKTIAEIQTLTGDASHAMERVAEGSMAAVKAMDGALTQMEAIQDKARLSAAKAGEQAKSASSLICESEAWSRAS